MTISSESIKAGPFSGNDSTTTFAFSFKCFSSTGSDLKVVLTNSSGVDTTLTLTTDYTVSLNANQDTSPGGSITTTGSSSPPATGEKLTILNEPAYTQGTDLITGGGFYPDVVETALDRSTVLARRAKEEVGRSIQIPVSDSAGTTVLLPTNTLRASKALVFDADGDIGVSVDDYVDQVATVAASAAAAVVSAAAASTSASASSTSASASSTSAAAAAASYDLFDDRFLGAKSSDPSVDNDGNVLVDACLYFNTSNNVMMVYDLGTTTWLRTTPTSADQTNINTLSASAVVADMALLGTTDAVADMALLATTDCISDMNVLATADVVTDMNTLGTADVVSDMNVLGTADVVTDMNVLATADVVTDMNVLATADVVTDMNVLGTADVVTDMNTLGTADVVTDMNVLATGANVTAMGLLGNATTVTNMGLLGTAAVVTDLGILGTADVVTDLNTLGTADVVSDLNTLGTADVVSDMNTLGTGANVTAMATCATNEASINRYSDEYTIASSAPSSPSEGDLWYDSSSNVLSVHNGTTFVAVTSATAGIVSVAHDTSPQLGGDLDLNGNNIDFPTTANVSDCIDDDTFGTASATKLATSESIKAYVDAIEASEITTAGVTFSNYNTISGNTTTTTASTKNMFLMGTISVTGTAVWTIAGDGVLTII